MSQKVGCCDFRVIGLFCRHWSLGLAMHYVLIALLAVVVVVFAWIVLEAKVRFRRRSRAISQAVTGLPKSEQLEWANRDGRYANPAAVPRNLPVKHMTHSERYRYDNREGEFTD